MSARAEIGIIGAGPAGARAAELFATLGASVVMLDPKAPWEKPCGGGLTPPAFEEIPELEALKAEAQAVRAVRVEAGPKEGFTVPLERPMWVLSRLVLSRWQLERALRAGARHLPTKVNSLRRAGGGWRLETSDGPVDVPILVGADGAASLVRRVAAPKFDVELAPTRVAYPRGSGPTPETAVLRFYGGIAGYLWDFPRPDHRSVGIGVPNGTWRRPRLDGEIDEHRRATESCACPPERAGAVIGTAQRGHGDYARIAGPDFALLGDAAGLADPLTGEGIQNALRSAGLLVEAWAGGDLRAYPGLARAAFEPEFRVARIIRHSVFESEVGLRLIEKATRSRAWYGLVAAIVNGVNEHEAGPGALVRRWVRVLGARRSGSSGIPAVRRPVPCVCGCGSEAPELGACAGGRAAA